VNSYYSLYLWGEALGNENIKQHGRILAAMEIRSAKRYWHIKDGEDIYEDQAFNDQHCVGIIWNTSAEYGTWFSALDVCIHEIQSLPFTPLSELLLTKDWVEEELYFKGTYENYLNSRISQLEELYL
jgi:endo-1,3(4)-beta-glucanase